MSGYANPNSPIRISLSHHSGAPEYCPPGPATVYPIPNELSVAFMSSTFEQIFSAAVGEYAKQTGINLSENPFTEKLRQAESPEDILQLLQEQAKAFNGYRNKNQSLSSSLSPIVGVLHAFSRSLGKTSNSVSRICLLPHLFLSEGPNLILPASPTRECHLC